MDRNEQEFTKGSEQVCECEVLHLGGSPFLFSKVWLRGGVAWLRVRICYTFGN